MPKPQQIKPFIEEISLAFNPANRKQFILKKDMEETMFDKLIEMLKDQKVVFKEDEIKKFLKDSKLSDEGQVAVLAIAKIVKDSDSHIPDDFFSKLVKAVPELSKIAQVVEVEKKPDLEALKTLKETLTKEIEEKVKTELGSGDEVIKILQKDFDAAKVTITELEKSVQVEKDARMKTEIETLIKEEGFPGDFEKNVELLLELKKTSVPLFDRTVESFKQSAQLLKTAGIFSEMGSADEGKPSTAKSASDKLMEFAKAEMAKDSTLTMSEAMRKVAKDNIDLYKVQTVKTGGNN